MLKKKTVKKVH